MQAYAWAMRGFQGIIAMLTSATQEGVLMPPAALDELRHWRTALDRVIENQERMAAGGPGAEKPTADQAPARTRRRLK